MSRLGVINFKDVNNIDASIYIYGAVSLAALATYCNTLREFTAAEITKIEWSPDGEVKYDRTLAYGQRKTYIYHVNRTQQTLNFSGAVGDAYSANYYASLILKTTVKRHPCRSSIPSPLKSVFLQGRVIAPFGSVMASAYSVLIGSPVTFLSGELINPRQIHPMPQ